MYDIYINDSKHGLCLLTLLIKIFSEENLLLFCVSFFLFFFFKSQILIAFENQRTNGPVNAHLLSEQII